jgi:hypothetical protein
MVIAVEDAIKPEADRLFAAVVASWKKAHAFVLANGKTWNAVRTAKTGFDCEAPENKLPNQPYPMYANRSGSGRKQFGKLHNNISTCYEKIFLDCYFVVFIILSFY